MYLCSRHGLGIHDVILYGLSSFDKPCFQQTPDGALTGARWTDNDYTHSLLQLLMELESLVDLESKMYK